MKRILITNLFIFLFVCLLQGALLNESFEGDWMPDMWSLNAGAGFQTEYWQKIVAGGSIYSDAFYSGSACAGIMKNGAISSWKPHNDFLITPELTPDATHHHFSFHAKQYISGYEDHFQVLLRYASGPYTIATLDSDAEANTFWTTYSYDLSAYEGIPVYISIRAYGNYINGLLLVDDVTGPEVTGAPVPPYLYVLPSYQNFGNQRMGTHSAEANIYIGNNGGCVMSVTNVSIVGSDSLNFHLYDTHTYPQNIMSMSDTIKVHIVFEPLSTDVKTAYLRIDYGADSTKVIPLYGTGVDSDAGGIIYLSQTEADFGYTRQGDTSTDLYLAAYNVGTGDVDIAGTSIVGPDAIEFRLTDINSYPNTIEMYNPSLPLDNLAVNVAFAPLSLGAKTAFLRFADSYGVNHDILLKGECVLHLPQGIPYLESFDWGYIPAEWSITNVSGTAGDWTIYPPGTATPAIEPFAGTGCIRFNSSSASSGSTRLESGQLQLEPYAAARMEFWMYHDDGATSANDRVIVQYHTGTGIWHNTALTVLRYNSSAPGWSQYIVDLSPLAGINTGRIGFLGISENGNDIFIDEIYFVSSTPYPSTAYISEVCDNLPGHAESTGFVEITSKAPYSQDIGNYWIRMGTFDEYGCFIPDYPDVMYIIPEDTVIGPAPATLIIGNGADEATFKAAWSVSGSINYLNGDAALDITCGKAYELWKYIPPSRFYGQVDFSPLVAVEQDAVHDTTSGWAFYNASEGTPGNTGGSSVLAAPKNLTFSSSTSNLIIHWDAVPGSAGYFIYHSGSPQGPWELESLSAIQDSVYTLPKSSTIPHEFFRVRATPDSIHTSLK